MSEFDAEIKLAFKRYFSCLIIAFIFSGFSVYVLVFKLEHLGLLSIFIPAALFDVPFVFGAWWAGFFREHPVGWRSPNDL